MLYHFRIESGKRGVHRMYRVYRMHRLISGKIREFFINPSLVMRNIGVHILTGFIKNRVLLQFVEVTSKILNISFIYVYFFILSFILLILSEIGGIKIKVSLNRLIIVMRKMMIITTTIFSLWWELCVFFSCSDFVVIIFIFKEVFINGKSKLEFIIWPKS